MKHPQNEKIEAGWANISGELLQDIPSGAVYLTHRSLTRFLFINDCDEKATFYLYGRCFFVSYKNIKMEERKKAQFL